MYCRDPLEKPYRNGITQEGADALLAKYVQIAIDAVNRLVTVHLNQNQFDALVTSPSIWGGSTGKRIANILEQARSPPNSTRPEQNTGQNKERSPKGAFCYRWAARSFVTDSGWRAFCCVYRSLAFAKVMCDKFLAPFASVDLCFALLRLEKPFSCCLLCNKPKDTSVTQPSATGIDPKT